MNVPCAGFRGGLPWDETFPTCLWPFHPKYDWPLSLISEVKQGQPGYYLDRRHFYRHQLENFTSLSCFIMLWNAVLHSFQH